MRKLDDGAHSVAGTSCGAAELAIMDSRVTGVDVARTAVLRAARAGWSSRKKKEAMSFPVRHTSRDDARPCESFRQNRE